MGIGYWVLGIGYWVLGIDPITLLEVLHAHLHLIAPCSWIPESVMLG